jgi:hypothetical protein
VADAGRKPNFAAWVWLWIAALALFELVAHPLIRAAVPSDESWERASAFVRERFEPGDRIVAAPHWADPIVRNHLGDLSSLRAAAPPDTGGFDRLWELGIRGATTRTDTATLEVSFDDVEVRMWPLRAPRVIYDFVEELRDARVEILRDGMPRSCPWTRARPDPGGLERGPMRPAERFVCDPKRPWLWVGPTVLADLELHPRRCIWQHPAGPEPLRTIFEDVPLGDRLVVRAGIDYQVARERRRAPVSLTLVIDEEVVGELVHHDGEGWSGVEIDTSDRNGQRARVRFETRASDPTARLFCYSASTQQVGDHE